MKIRNICAFYSLIKYLKIFTFIYVKICIIKKFYFIQGVVKRAFKTAFNKKNYLHKNPRPGNN